MQSLHKESFEMQKAIREKLKMQIEAQDTVDDSVFLHILSGNEELLLPIRDVSEVAEYQRIKPYPLIAPGHCGIIHLRGNVVPVISIHKSCNNSENIKATPKRIVVLRTTEGDRFALVATSVKKVNVSKTDFTSDKTVTFNGNPVTLISADYLLNHLGER